MRKPSLGRMTLALPLMFGIFPAVGGYQILREWAAEGTPLLVSAVVLLLSGATMLLSAVWLLASLGRRRFPLWSAGVASLLAGGVFAVATISDVLPCSGPT